MRIAAIQHFIRGDAAQDAAALAVAARDAASREAEFVVLPAVPSLANALSPVRERLLEELTDLAPAVCVAAGPGSASWVSALPEGAGTVGVLSCDSCLDPIELARMAAEKPSVLVLSPCSETDFQSEAALEFAIALSDSVAGVVVVAECAGGEPLEPGHGGSGVVVLGEVVAEALAGEGVLLVDVPVPIPTPEPREPLPSVPPLLQQRFARNTGVLSPEHGPDLS
ncbi:MAG: hypothetical protein HGB10_11390 [Coriobacteriia bacterium]|nr:hypothetical protein [Coriobacteriia bacterium]